MGLNIILASDEEGNIGYKNELLYYFTKDLKRFKDLTKGKTVVMGRNTWNSLPNKLPNRTNVVITSRLVSTNHKPDLYVSSIDEIIELSNSLDIWVIGGKRLYEDLIPFADIVEHTFIRDVSKKSDTTITDLNRLLDNFKSLDIEIVQDTDKLLDRECKLEFRTYKK